jgi:hypothetical protein
MPPWPCRVKPRVDGSGGGELELASTSRVVVNSAKWQGEIHRSPPDSWTLPDPLALPRTEPSYFSMAPMLSRLSGVTFALFAFVAVASAKASCAVVGDSIAVGAGQYLRTCRVNAKGGIPSSAVADRVDSSADVNVVSAGSNDPANPNLRAILERIRSRAHRVIWILPIDDRARTEVQAVATAHGDPVISFSPASDHVHPRSEVNLARSIARVRDRGGAGRTDQP